LQNFFSRLRARLMKSWSWVLLIVLTIAIKWVSLYPDWVERNYTYGIYPVISKVQRILFGWISLSIGDLFYAFLVIVVIYKTVQFFKRIVRKKFTRKYFINGLQQLLFLFLAIYVSFNLLWGLNYNRRGIAHQLELDVKLYTVNDLDTLCRALQVKMNYYAARVDTISREDIYGKSRNVYKVARETYRIADDKYSYLIYEPSSLKSSMVGFLGKFVGFQGYYNPFTGEGQVKRSIPVFLQPFVACHEIAHQLGYAKENEANFVGFLAARESEAVDFVYSAYYDMYQYSIREIMSRDYKRGIGIDTLNHKLVWRDRREMARYILKMENPVAPLMLKMYDGYLRMNNQPKGYRTYNEVVTWLVAYYKKYGVEAL
jgi:hypothetical protein